MVKDNASWIDKHKTVFICIPHRLVLGGIPNDIIVLHKTKLHTIVSDRIFIDLYKTYILYQSEM
mgnify:CR=1 FL=1